MDHKTNNRRLTYHLLGSYRRFSLHMPGSRVASASSKLFGATAAVLKPAATPLMIGQIPPVLPRQFSGCIHSVALSASHHSLDRVFLVDKPTT